MPTMADFRTVLACAAGVILAGYIMNKGRDLGFLADAHEGFDYIG